jgi:ElaB/YqjD/DUF883 family membrane-anchored ribosome-binding protein
MQFLITLKTAATWIKANWRLLAVLMLLGAIYAYGYTNGRDKSNKDCEAILQEIKDVRQKQIDELLKDADKKSQEYEEQKQKETETLMQTKASLKDEQVKNKVYYSCHAGTEFLQLYKDVAAGSGSASAR